MYGEIAKVILERVTIGPLIRVYIIMPSGYAVPQALGSSSNCEQFNAVPPRWCYRLLLHSFLILMHNIHTTPLSKKPLPTCLDRPHLQKALDLKTKIIPNEPQHYPKTQNILSSSRIKSNSKSKL